MTLLCLLILLFTTSLHGQGNVRSADTSVNVDTLAYGRDVIAIANYDVNMRWGILVYEYHFCTDSLLPILRYSSSDSITLGFKLSSFFIKESPSGTFYLLKIASNYQSARQNAEAIEVVHPISGKKWYESENIYTKQVLAVDELNKILRLLEEERPWNFVKDDTRPFPSKYLELINGDTSLIYSSAGDEPRTNLLIDKILTDKVSSL